MADRDGGRLADAVTPRLLVLDDREGLLRDSPGGRRLTELADTRFLDVPLADVPDAELVGVTAIVTIRERTRLDAGTLARFPDLGIVLQTGGHAYHVDLAETARRGIPVTLWRTSAAPEAAMRELTFGLAIAALRRFPEATRAFDAGAWPPLLGGTLAGRRLGVLGMGRQGRAVAELGRAFGMDVVAWARPGGAPATDDVPRLDLDELLATTDVLSVNLRLTDESRGLLDRDRLREMKPGSVLVNTARGAIVDEVALAEVLRDGPLRAAGLDVFAVEPLPADSPLRTLPNVVLAPHVGWVVEETFAEFAQNVADQYADHLAGRLPASELA
ncbi:D-2-hydroxyacid dehydrogenase family protein [Geodermatophilaceae bacterium NBWT11]|nr:D-2-hydroxyacid dehydrogenase family protein [Geodermatophilaceae bacterium NBWT11]